MIHDARVIPYAELLEGLESACDSGWVHRRDSAELGLSQYTYTQRCVYEGAWNRFTLLARGLVLDRAAQSVVATPFPKFFNYGERDIGLPDESFDVYEKLDGSLIIAYRHAGRWLAATKGSFRSDQAVAAQAMLDAADLSPLVPGTTYLFEYVGPSNRIVVSYAEHALVMLGAYAGDGEELSYARTLATADALGWTHARRYPFGNLAELVRHTEGLPADSEGFVVRFAGGLRIKLKGAAYRRIHALISRCTPLAMWEAMTAGDDMPAIRRELPEEFWGDFDSIVGVLATMRDSLVSRIMAVVQSCAHLSDKEVGLGLNRLDPDVRGFVFRVRKSGGRIEGKTLVDVMKAIRPNGNVLPGYVPSYAMHRATEEAG